MHKSYFLLCLLRLLYRCSGYWYDVAEHQQSSAAAAAVTTPPAVTTSTTLAQARAPSKDFVSTLEMSADEKATAPQMEPAFEALLRSRNIHEDVIWACRIQDILDREVFVSLLHTVEGFKEAVTSGLGIDPAAGFSHSREMAKMVKAWNSAKVQAEAKTKVDAVAKAHGEPISMLKCDWVSLMTRTYTETTSTRRGSRHSRTSKTSKKLLLMGRSRRRG